MWTPRGKGRGDELRAKPDACRPVRGADGCQGRCVPRGLTPHSLPAGASGEGQREEGCGGRRGVCS